MALSLRLDGSEAKERKRVPSASNVELQYRLDQISVQNVDPDKTNMRRNEEDEH